jgi:ABC-type multidrug transport system fused ATPase/permease subunit
LAGSSDRKDIDRDDAVKYRHQLGVLLSKRARWQLLGVMSGSLGVSIAETGSVVLVVPLMALLTGQPLDQGALGVVSHALGDPSVDVLRAIILGAVVGGFVLKDVATMVFRWWMLGFLAREQAMTSTKLLDYYLRAPIGLHQERGTSDLIRTMGTAVALTYGSFLAGTLSLFTQALTILSLLVALFVVMPLPTLGVLAYFGVAGFLFAFLVRPRAERASRDVMAASQESMGATFDGLFGVKEIKLRHSYGYFIEAARRPSLRAAYAGRVSTYLTELPKYILEILFVGGIALLIGLVLGAGSTDSVVGALALLGAAGFRILPSITGLLGSITSLRVGSVALKEVTADLWTARRLGLAELGEASHGRLPLRETISLEELTFRYRPELPDVVNHVTLDIPAGSSLALVGGSGAGKTTLVDLLLGFHTPTQGRICADGTDISTDLVGWQNNIAMVPQEVYLIDGTVRRNIAFDRDADDMDEGLLADVVRRSQLEDLVASLPDGLNTEIGERGGRLSGGQKQRIGIARALYRRPSLLVLDEATSALDNMTERSITETIEALHGDMTVIVVAHRLSTVRNVDKLVFMVDGRVAASGTFDEVRRDNADFARLVELGSLVRSDNSAPIGPVPEVREASTIKGEPQP